MIDLLITNGMVIDGTGSPGFFAAVAVEGDRVSIHRERRVRAGGGEDPSTPLDMWSAPGLLTCTPTPD